MVAALAHQLHGNVDFRLRRRSLSLFQREGNAHTAMAVILTVGDDEFAMVVFQNLVGHCQTQAKAEPLR